MQTRSMYRRSSGETSPTSSGYGSRRGSIASLNMLSQTNYPTARRPSQTFDYENLLEEDEDLGNIPPPPPSPAFKVEVRKLASLSNWFLYHFWASSLLIGCLLEPALHIPKSPEPRRRLSNLYRQP